MALDLRECQLVGEDTSRRAGFKAREHGPIGSVGALALCAFGLLGVPAGEYELRVGAFVSLACALLLLSAAQRASAV